jgi:hypothetical protein
MIPTREIGNALLTRIGEAMIELGLVGPDGLPLPLTLAVWPFDVGAPSMLSTAPDDQVEEALLNLVMWHMRRRRQYAVDGVNDHRVEPRPR